MPLRTPDSPQSLAEQTQKLLQLQDFGSAYEAFGMLHDLLYPHLLGRAKRKMRPEEAEDMAQETLMGLFRCLKAKECPKNVEAWAVDVLTKRIADHYRLLRNTEELLAPPKFWEGHGNRQQALTGIGANPLTTAIKSEEQRQLNVLLDSLSEDVRSVVEAHYFDELPWVEIADQHGLSVDAVKQKSQRALSAMVKLAVKRGYKHGN
jgi:RNA polymerase sigma factor (sigma-70 family)